MTAQGARIAVDIGGTFTDLVLVGPGGTLLTGKLRSTPRQPEQAVLEGVADLLRRASLTGDDVLEVRHGTTIGSNTLIQKSGARCGLITTRGFRDVLEIGRLRTPTMFDLSWDKPAPLVPRRHRLEVDERLLASGEVLRPLDEAGLLAAGRALAEAGIEALAICFLHAHRNPVHEQRAAELLRQAFPGLALSVSSDVCPEPGEYERTSTTVVNAYVLPAMRGYLERLSAGLKEMGIAAPLFVAASSGGLAGEAYARERPVYFVSSGRSAGAVGAARLGTEAGEPGLVVFDMGGTTASASLVCRGEVERTREYEFREGMSTNSRFIKAGGTLMRVPAVDVAEVGSGGGSIATVDPGGALLVGPRSAGSEPGPSCYGRGGTDATVTDANLVLGYLPESLAGGSLVLDRDAACRAVERHVARPLGVSLERAAHGIRAVANATMARAVRAVTVERGLDPRDLTLMAFGGSGPAHACDLAFLLGMKAVLFPPGPGVFTASGMLASEPARETVRPWPGLLQAFDLVQAERAMLEMSRDAGQALRLETGADVPVDFAFSLDLRFRHQDIEVPVPLPRPLADGSVVRLREEFLAQYRAMFGYASSDAIETSALRLQARVRSGGGLRFADLRPPAPQVARQATRLVHFGGRWIPAAIMDLADFQGEADGPLVLEGADSTIVVPPGVRVAAADHGIVRATVVAEGFNADR
ncbi:MAG: hydantoinase/oxoprolinase family protein [Alsobacter sp.]